MQPQSRQHLNLTPAALATRLIPLPSPRACPKTSSSGRVASKGWAAQHQAHAPRVPPSPRGAVRSSTALSHTNSTPVTSAASAPPHRCPTAKSPATGNPWTHLPGMPCRAPPPACLPAGARMLGKTVCWCSIWPWATRGWGLLCQDPMGSQAALVVLLPCHPAIYAPENMLSTWPLPMPISPNNNHSSVRPTSPMLSSPVPPSLSSGSHREAALVPKEARLHLES